MWIALICKCTEKSEKKDSFGIVYCNGNPDLVRLESWNPRLLHIFPILLQADFLKKQLEAQKAEIEKLKGKAGLAFSFLLSLYLLAASSDERNRKNDPGADPGVHGGGRRGGCPGVCRGVRVVGADQGQIRPGGNPGVQAGASGDGLDF